MLALFPTGRPAGRRWRPVVWAAIAGTVLIVVGNAFGHAVDDNFRSGSNPYAVDGWGIDEIYLAGQVLFAVALVGAIASLIVRFRRSSGVERQQLKWVAYVVCALAVVGPLAIAFYFDSVLVRIAIAVVVTALPVAICVAILRYRLYDIDIIISRTLVYGVVSLLVAGSYVVVAVFLGAIAGDRHSAWVTAGATLAAVGVFRPLRRRLQDVVDRRFRKARYDALARIAVFLEELRAGHAAPDGLGPVLRDAVELPDLEIHYVLPGPAGGHVDERGRPVSEDLAAGRTYSAIERAGTPLAVVSYSTPDRQSADIEHPVALIDDVLDRAGLAIEIARLQAEVRHQLGEVQASRARIVAAGYAERRRLERDLHDGAQQRLVSIGLALRHAQHQLGPSEVCKSIEEAVDQIGVAISDLRELANGVRPAHLDHGLGVALRELAGRTPVPTEVRVCDDRFPGDVEATAYFVACEAVTNAVKHAAARRLLVQAERRGSQLVVTVRDDGVGGAATAERVGVARPLRPSGRDRRPDDRAEFRRNWDNPDGCAAVRVLIAEDQALLREGLARLFRDGGHEVPATYADAHELLPAVVERRPDLVVLDVRMPPTFTDEGTRAAREIKDQRPDVGVLVLSQHIETVHSVDLVTLGGFGYVLKDRVLDVDEFLATAQRIADGGSALDPQVVARLLTPSGRDDPLAVLSERERQVLELMAEGLTNTAIARRLVLSERTVEGHIRGLMLKLDLADDADSHRRVLAVLTHLRAAQ